MHKASYTQMNTCAHTRIYVHTHATHTYIHPLYTHTHTVNTHKHAKDIKVLHILYTYTLKHNHSLIMTRMRG